MAKKSKVQLGTAEVVSSVGVNADLLKALDLAASAAPRKSKYNNQKTTVDNVTFDSKREAERYQVLKLMEEAGEISGLLVGAMGTARTSYDLKVCGMRVARYVADFTYFLPDRTVVVEDCKGYRNRVYRLKKKLMKAIYNISILET